MHDFEARVEAVKATMGKELLLLAHHYQRDPIVQVAHYRGDSLDLARRGSKEKDATVIVFCGVHFMAEASAVLAHEGQRVYLPDHGAGCPLADYATGAGLEEAWERFGARLGDLDDVVPVCYVNTSAEVKAFVGIHGGMTCTSSSAAKIFTHVLSQGKRVFFVPDQHLGTNTANTLGIPREARVLYDQHQEEGGLVGAPLETAKVILWAGNCRVHQRFTREHVLQAREQHPGCRIIVHPECSEEVTTLADDMGSTAFIVTQVQEAKPGSTIVVGTEVNLVDRLAEEHPEVTVIPLTRSLCKNMYKITPEKLLVTLETLPDSQLVTVPDDIAAGARLALERMLAVS